MTDKEKPFTMQSWEDLRRELKSASRRSKLWLIVREEMKLRGHYRARPQKPKP